MNVTMIGTSQRSARRDSKTAPRPTASERSKPTPVAVPTSTQLNRSSSQQGEPIPPGHLSLLTIPQQSGASASRKRTSEIRVRTALGSASSGVTADGDGAASRSSLTTAAAGLAATSSTAAAGGPADSSADAVVAPSTAPWHRGQSPVGRSRW
jgi:hypothetical protein